jgi:hypothetical protein
MKSGAATFHSVDELIVQGVHAWREKHHVEPDLSRSTQASQKLG